MKTATALPSKRPDRTVFSARANNVAKGLIGIAALLALTACNLQVDAAPGAEAKAQAPLPQVSVAKVRHESITEWDEFTGRLEATETVVLRPRVSGYIDKVVLQEGALVKQGDLLFTIDARPYQAEVNRLQAELKAAKSRLALASSDLDRAQSLKSQNAISVEQVDNREAGRDQASAQLEATAAALAIAQLNLDYTQVKAPISGRVSRALITEGNYVNAGQSELTTLVSTEQVYAYFDADEQTFLKYRATYQEQAQSDINTPVFLRLANESEYTHQGYVDFIDNQVNPQTGTIRARAVFSNLNHQFTPGLFARIKLAATPVYDAILISDRAIGTDLSNKFALVLTEDQRVEYRGIELGPKLDDMRIVRSGLKPGESIVVNGLQRVRPGTQVNPEVVEMFTAESLARLHSQLQVVDTVAASEAAALTAKRNALEDSAIVEPRG